MNIRQTTTMTITLMVAVTGIIGSAAAASGDAYITYETTNKIWALGTAIVEKNRSSMPTNQLRFRQRQC